MKCVYFVRHGQTIWNVENKICGASDIALTKHGHEQAIKTGEYIKEQGIEADEILYSPLIRAKDTAIHISNITGIKAREDIRLIEQNFGKYESTPRNGQEFLESKRHFADRYCGGESMLQLAQRVYNLLDEIKNSDKTYILVAHNGIARVVQSYFNEMSNDEYASFGVDNCSVTRYEFTDDFAMDSPVTDERAYKFYGADNCNTLALVDDYKGIMTPIDLYKALSNVWSKDTCAPRMASEWTEENMTLGQCSITAFLTQDIFGGKVYGILRPGGNYHCYNVIGDCLFDLTSEQFGDTTLDYSDNPEQFREDHFQKEEKHLRYEALKKSLVEYLESNPR